MRLFKKAIPTKYGMDKKIVENNFAYLSSIGKCDVVFAGDSITWLYPLSELIEVESFCRGINGDTADQLLRRWDTNITPCDPKLIVLLIGTNDIAHRRELIDILNDTFACIDKAIAHNKDIKFILEAVYPTNNMPNRRISVIKQYNEMLKERAKDYDCVTYVDYFDLLAENGKANKAYFSDGLHPTAQGYEVISNQLNPLIKELLK